MRKFYIIFIFILILPFKLYAHDESSLLSTDCSHKYMSVGASTYSQIYFSFSIKNLKSHGVVNLDAEDGYLQVNVELKNASGDIEKYADRIYYQIKDNEPVINQNWITVDTTKNEDDLNSLKSRIGDKPSTTCNVIL